VQDDWRTAALDDRTRAMLEYAERLAKDVHSIDAAFIQSLRDRGLSDEDVLNVAEVSGFFAYYTRLADGLGVDPEASMGAKPGWAGR
jgi:uncharacterized peroxidase-related enzyme